MTKHEISQRRKYRLILAKECRRKLVVAMKNPEVKTILVEAINVRR